MIPSPFWQDLPQPRKFDKGGEHFVLPQHWVYGFEPLCGASKLRAVTLRTLKSERVH